MRTEGLKGALSPRLAAIPIATLLLAMTLAFMGFSSGTHDATVSMVPVNSKAGENIEYTLTVTNASGDNIDNVTLEVPLDEGGNARYRVATPVPAPESWTSELPENDGFGYAKKITWRTDNAQAHIAAGGSEDFTFTATTPLYDRVDNWTCRTSDVSGYVDNDLVMTRVDNMRTPLPTLVWPDNGENINDNTPNLDWNPVIDPSVPVTYDLLVDNDLDFLSPEVDVTGMAVDNFVTVELGEKIWNWKVRAVDNAGNIGPWASPRSFRVDVTPPEPPARTWPADGENINDNTPNLDWDPVIDPSMPVTYDLMSGWWNENWTKRRPITISGSHPENYQIKVVLPFYDNSIRFLENENTGVLPYWIENYTANNMTVWVRRLETTDSTIHVYYGATAGSTENGDNTFVFFDHFEGDTVDTSKWIVVKGSPSVSNSILTLYRVAGSGERMGTIDDWSPFNKSVRGKYKFATTNGGEVWFMDSLGYTVLTTYHGGTHRADTRTPIQLTTFSKPANVWYVYDRKVFSTTQKYYLDDVLDVTHTVDYSSASDHYIYMQADDGDGSKVEMDYILIRKITDPEPTASVGDEEAAAQTRITDDNYQITTELSEGIWHWKLRVVDNAGNIGVWSPLRSFRVDITSPPAPNLLAQDNGKKICDNTPTFEWTAITIENSLPATYELQVDNDLDFSSPEYENSGMTDNACTIPDENELPNGNYSWRVRARDNAGNWSENWSDSWTILINSTPHDATVILAPINSKPGISIDYVLTVTDNATGDNIDNVTLEIPLDENGNALYRVVPPIPAPAGWTSGVPTIDGLGYATKVRWLADNPSAHIAAGESENFTFTATTPLYDGTYFWTCFTEDIIGYVDNDNFATRVDSAPPPAPTLLEPDNGAIVIDNTPTFGWTAVVDDSLPVTYAIQVDNDNDFSSPEIDVLGLIDNAYTSSVELVKDNYSWRVRATDNAGNVGSFSPTWTIQITGIVRGVDISISPIYQSGLPSDSLYYTVVTKNIGNVLDNYLVTPTDTEGWNVHFSVVELNPTYDACVGDNYTGTGHGGSYYLFVGTNGENWRTFLKFDMSGITARATINSATLYAYPRSPPGPPNGENMIVDAKRVDNDDWDETITWNNAPWDNVGAVLDSDQVTVPTSGEWNDWDVTSFIAGECAGDGVASILLQSENEGLPLYVNYYTEFGPPPRLVVNYTSPSGYVVELGPGENDTRTMTVEIPENATGCTSDNVTVTATSQADNTVSDNDSCVAHVQVVRDVEVLIEPDSQAGVIGENVVFTVTVKNTGNVWDNYKLENNDDAGWALELDNDYLEIPENENRKTKLTVPIPDNENLVCTTDNITVVATAVDNAEVTDNDNATVHAVPSWTGTAVFSLVDLYTVDVEKIIDLNQGSKLVVKFYTYGDAYENENVIENFVPPAHVEENEIAWHPEGIGVKKARLELTYDNTENVISTIASFTVTKTMLEVRFAKIPLEWALASPAGKTALEIEFSQIPLYWALAPS